MLLFSLVSLAFLLNSSFPLLFKPVQMSSNHTGFQYKGITCGNDNVMFVVTKISKFSG